MPSTEHLENRSLHLIEQRHRLLTDYAKDVIWTMSLAGAMTYTSPAIFPLHGFSMRLSHWF